MTGILRIFALFVLFISINLFADTKLSAESIEGSIKVDAKEVSEMIKITVNKEGKTVRKVLFLDTRNKKDLEQGGTIPGALHLDLKKSEEFNQENILLSPKFSGDIMLFCNGHSCVRAEEATRILLDWQKNNDYGVKINNIYYFRDGFPAYRDLRFEDGSVNPVVRPY